MKKIFSCAVVIVRSGVAFLPEFHCSCVSWQAAAPAGCAEAGRNRDQRRADSHADSGAKAPADTEADLQIICLFPLG